MEEKEVTVEDGVSCYTLGFRNCLVFLMCVYIHFLKFFIKCLSLANGTVTYAQQQQCL